VSGGLEGYLRSSTGSAAEPAALISRDAMAALLGRLPLPPPPPPPLGVLDSTAAVEAGGDGFDSDNEGSAGGLGGAGAAVAGGSGGGGGAGARWGWRLPRVTAVDVRRYDERTLYGAIPGAIHLPGEQVVADCWWWWPLSGLSVGVCRGR